MSYLNILELFSEMTHDIQEDILFQTPITHIDYSGACIKAVDQQGNEYQGKKVIITVPLSVLKSQLIQFTPPLPQQKQEAIQRIGFNTGMKVFLKFKQAFWEEESTFIFGGNVCPSYEVQAMGRPTQTPIMCAYLMGKFSLPFMKISPKEQEELLLSDLSEIYQQERKTLI